MKDIGKIVTDFLLKKTFEKDRTQKEDENEDATEMVEVSTTDKADAMGVEKGTTVNVPVRNINDYHQADYRENQAEQGPGYSATQC